MTILLVEDEENKRRHVMELLSEKFPRAVVTEAKSLHSALKHVVENGFDLVILDMTMPTFDIDVEEEGGRPQAYGGRELIRQMTRRAIRTPVVVLTQFDRFGKEPNQRTIDELDEELRRDHPFYLGSIKYNVAVDTWRDELAKVVASVG